jgi:proline dehydrogenase
MTNVARYANGHMFSLDGVHTPLTRQIATALGNLDEADFANLDQFTRRVNQLGEVAEQRNCKLYIDAEQAIIQGAIQSFGQQMTRRLNQGENVTIMNGFQCYLKRMTSTLEMEVRASQAMGFNLGIKLIRGAYMNEERSVAAENSVESPVWEDIEETHSCYNDSMEHIIRNMKHTDMLFVASHNTYTCDLAMQLLASDIDLKEKDRVIFG